MLKVLALKSVLDFLLLEVCVGLAVVKRILCQPLFHFLILGLLLFVLFARVNDARPAVGNRIHSSKPRMNAAYFTGGRR